MGDRIEAEDDWLSKQRLGESSVKIKRQRQGEGGHPPKNSGSCWKLKRKEMDLCLEHSEPQKNHQVNTLGF